MRENHEHTISSLKPHRYDTHTKETMTVTHGNLASATPHTL